MANATNKKLTSTIGYQYYGIGADGSDKALSVAYLENTISIGIFNLLPSSQQTNNSKFDYKQGTTIFLKGKQSKTLSRLIKRAQKKILDGEKFEPAAVSSASNLIEVANGTNYGLGEGLTIAIYSGINANKTCDAPAIFKFNDDKIITSYDHKSGTYSEGTMDADIDYLITQLEEFAKGITNAHAHCIKKEMSFDVSKFASRQIQICQALNINLETASSSKASWNNNWNNSSTSTANMSTADLLNELDG